MLKQNIKQYTEDEVNDAWSEALSYTIDANCGDLRALLCSLNNTEIMLDIAHDRNIIASAAHSGGLKVVKMLRQDFGTRPLERGTTAYTNVKAVEQYFDDWWNELRSKAAQYDTLEMFLNSLEYNENDPHPLETATMNVEICKLLIEKHNVVPMSSMVHHTAIYDKSNVDYHHHEWLRKYFDDYWIQHTELNDDTNLTSLVDYNRDSNSSNEKHIFDDVEN